MPAFFKKNLLSKTPVQPVEPMLPSPLDTPELPPADNEERPHGIHESFVHQESSEHEYQHEHSDEQYHQHEDHHEGEEHYPENYDVDPVQTLLTWTAPSRPYRKKDRSFYTYATVLVVLASIIAFLFNYVLLIGALLALLFLVYVINFIPPEDVEYKISTQGITIGDHFYHWFELDSFWLEQKDGFKLVHVITQIHFPTKLILVEGEIDENELKNMVARYLPFHEIAPRTTVEKWGESLQRHFPLENPHA